MIKQGSNIEGTAGKLVAEQIARIDDDREQLGRIALTLRFFRRWPVLSVFILSVMVIMAIFAPLITTNDPEKSNLLHRNYPPMFQDAEADAKQVEKGREEGNYLMGTDQLGRDLWSRLAYGARVSLSVAVVSLFSGTLIGVALGLVAGWYGGLIDEAITRFVDVWLGLPFILVALVIAVVLGTSLVTVFILLALLSWTPFVRQIRAEVLSLKHREYVLAATVSGSSTMRILLRHLLPGVMNTIIVIATFRIGQLILIEAFLSFLGAGIPPPTPAWGGMINDGRGYLRDAWWISMFPGAAIFFTVASMSFFGDWLRDRLDPRLRQLD
ncbi:MAG: ABC transporter permease [Chloroflexi bacterium]|nr:ABC transporter permease [Bacteroidota bacterium]MQC82596.1 ABC transporter permease [Chloroflexota bacterium]